MKKRVAAILCSITLLGSSLAPLAAGATAAETRTPPPPLVQSLVPANQQQAEQLLTLEEVLDLALNNNDNLKLLKYKYDYINSNKKDLKDKKEMLDVDIPQSPIPFDPGNFQDPLNLMNGLQQAQITALNKQMYTQYRQAVVAVEQLDSQRYTTKIEQEQAKEGIRLQMIARYITLLSLEEQLAVTADYLAVLERDVKATARLYHYGMASEENLIQIREALQQQETEYETLVNDYYTQLLQLLFDLHLPYEPGLKLAQLDMETLQAIERVEDEQQLIDTSFQMRMAAEEITQARWEVQNNHSVRKSVTRDNLRLTEGKQRAMETDLSKMIEATYREGENAFQTYQQARIDYEAEQANYQRLQVKYRQGFVSKHDYEKSHILVQQAKAKYEVAKMTYYVMLEKVEAMERGLILGS